MTAPPMAMAQPGKFMVCTRCMIKQAQRALNCAAKTAVNYSTSNGVEEAAPFECFGFQC